MRIIAGTLKGRRLEGPSGPGLRPTSDSLRETLFNVLGASIAGATLLDAFAGTGAVGLEALSRGARQVTFVERDRAALAALRENIARCRVEESCVIVSADFQSLASRRPAPGPFNCVFLDPPYEITDLEPLLLEAGRVAAPDARLVLEHSRRTTSPEAAAVWRRTSVLTAGDSALSFYVASPGPAAPEPA